MFSKPPKTAAVELEDNHHSTKPKEIKQAIMTSSTRKAPGSDGLFFMIIQHIYQVIPELFHTIYSVLINHDYHPLC